MAVTGEREWQGFCAALADQDIAPGLDADDRFHTNASRMAHRDALRAAIAPAIARMPLAYWLLTFRRDRVPAGYRRGFEHAGGRSAHRV